MGARILDFRLRLRSVERFWIKELKFNPKDALYETLRERLERVRRSYVANAALSSVGNLRNALAPQCPMHDYKRNALNSN